MNSPNAGVILRPNGDVRLDCVVPFVIGNLFDMNFCDIWKIKAQSCWQDKRVQEFYQAMDYVTGENTLNKNYIDPEIII